MSYQMLFSEYVTFYTRLLSVICYHLVSDSITENKNFGKCLGWAAFELQHA